MLDNRIMRVSLEIGGILKIYESLAITASGMKFGNSIQGEAKVTISNLSRSDINYIIRETSPLNKNRVTKKLMLDVGRVSTGYTRVYVGDIWRSNVSQPPDVVLSMECKTGQILKGQYAGVTQPSVVPLSDIGRAVGASLGIPVVNEATDKNISNYQFSGAALKQVDALCDAGGVNAFVDDDVLYIKDADKALEGRSVVVSESTGLIGLPEITDSGVKVKILFLPGVHVGGMIDLQCRLMPEANGQYQIYKLGFEFANRADPFYWIAEAFPL